MAKAKLPKCMAPGCRRAGSHGNVNDVDAGFRWCWEHREQHHVLLITP